MTSESAPAPATQQATRQATRQAGDSRRSLSYATVTYLSILYTLIYVLPLYLSKATRPSARLSRDAPSVIRARVGVVGVSCVVCTLSTAAVLVGCLGASPAQVLRLLGCWPVSPLDVAKVLLLTAVLFAGPLFEKGIVEGAWTDWIRGRHVREVLGSWAGWRNYVAGPVTEEMVFRSAIIPLHLAVRGVTPGRVVFVPPLFFGIAHLHHLYEFALTHPSSPVLAGLLRSTFQFAYTSIFGFYASFVFVNTHSLPAVIVAHSFCNWCGLPRVWGPVEPGVPLGPPSVSTDPKDAGRGLDALRVGTDRDSTLRWTVAYYVLLIGGLIGFSASLVPLTGGSDWLPTG